MDQRQSKRYVINQVVEFSMMHEHFIEGRGLNLSESGLLIETDQMLDVHSRIFVMLTLPLDDGEKTVKCDTTIVHSEKAANRYRSGLQFMDMDASDREALKAFLAEGLPPA